MKEEPTDPITAALLTLQLYLVSALVAAGISLGLFSGVIIPLLIQKEDTRIIRVLSVTAYSPRVIETDSTPFINAFGSPVAEGQIAVSRDLFLAGWVFERRIWIQDMGVFVIMDRMNVRFKDSIDIFFFSTKRAKAFGRKKLVVALLGSTR